MSRFPEQRLWDRMRAAITRRDARLERFENLVSDGVPDVLACSRGIVTWCELKAVEDYPKRLTTRLLPSGKGMRQDQMNWHLDWRNAGGRSVIVIGVAFKALYIVSGAFADEVNEMTATQLEDRALARTWPQLARIFNTEGPL